MLGGGDPAVTILFDEKDPKALFRHWARALAARGIRRVRGGIVLDDTVFDREYIPEPWRIYGLHYWWSAPVAGLVLNDSCVDIRVLPDPTPGAPVRVTCSPRTGYVSLRVEARTSSAEALAAALARILEE